MSIEKQRDIASKGGKAAHRKGTAHEWTVEQAREAGRKGGAAAHHHARRPRALRGSSFRIERRQRSLARGN
jgi:general stress protein YciG